MEDEQWHSRLLPQLYVCLMGNMLTGRKVEKYLNQRLGHQAVEGGGEQVEDTGRMKNLDPSEQALRSVRKNMLALSTLFLDDDENQVTLRLLIVGTKPSEQFHGLSNARLRGAGECQTWLLEMLTGGFQAYIGENWKVLSSFCELQYIGFSPPPPSPLRLHRHVGQASRAD